MVRGFCPKSTTNLKNKKINKIPVAHKATARVYDGIIISWYVCKQINYSA